MLIHHVQAYVNGNGMVHVQATGPAFPTGYASGDFRVGEEAYSAISKAQRFGSLRPGSESKYARLAVNGDTIIVGGERVCMLAELVKALNAPSPAYRLEQAGAVSEHVRVRLSQLQTPEPQAQSQEDSAKDEIIAQLKKDLEAEREGNREKDATIAALRSKIRSFRELVNDVEESDAEFDDID